jgi:hypothetical protein
MEEMQGIVGNNPCPVLYREVPFILNISGAACSYIAFI